MIPHHAVLDIVTQVALISPCHSIIILQLTIIMASMQMGMMKEHARGPIKCCETLAADSCLQTRAKELVCNENFHPIEVTTTRRGREDTIGGNSTARVLGSPCIHTPLMLLR